MSDSLTEPVADVPVAEPVADAAPVETVVVPDAEPVVNAAPVETVSEPVNATESVVEVVKAPPSSPTANTKKRTVAQPADLRLNTNQVEQILDCIKTVLDGRKPSAGAMLRIVANCLQSSRRMKLKPDLAKKLISHSMETFLRDPENELDEDSIQSLMACADVAINEGIDVLDDVGKGKISVNPKSCCNIM